MERRTHRIALGLALVAAGCAHAPGAPAPALAAATAASAPQEPAAAPDAPPDAKPHADAERWVFAASAYTYFVPDDGDYVQPTITADRGVLHLEARYNYEAQDTGSLWAGWNLSGGGSGDGDLSWKLTPMLGGVAGKVDGVAPGYKGSLAWRRFELYSEGEYLISTGDADDSFFYNWSELTYSPIEKLRVGIVTQRTRAYDADRDIERGVLIGWAGERLQFSAYLFNPDDGKPITVFSIALGF